MCPVCVQTVAIALIGLTSSTGLVALAMTSRDSARDVDVDPTSNNQPGKGETHA